MPRPLCLDHLRDPILKYRTIRVPFLTEAHAKIAQQVIEVDKERQADSVKRHLSVEGTELVA